MPSVIELPELGKVELIASSRARRISLSVRPSGEIRLVFPAHAKMAQEAIDFLLRKKSWIQASRERLQNQPNLKKHTPEEIALLRAQAKAYLPGRVAELAARFGFRYNALHIRCTRSKWGSCTSECNISLSLFLMTLPQHLSDYVIIHELCHTVHHNHSEKFHALADKCMQGREQALRKELRNYHPF